MTRLPAFISRAIYPLTAWDLRHFATLLSSLTCVAANQCVASSGSELKRRILTVELQMFLILYDLEFHRTGDSLFQGNL